MDKILLVYDGESYTKHFNTFTLTAINKDDDNLYKLIYDYNITLLIANGINLSDEFIKDIDTYLDEKIVHGINVPTHYIIDLCS